MFKRIVLVGLSSGLLLTLAGCGAGVEQEASAQRPHCAIQAVAVEAGKAPPAEASAAQVDCFATFAESISFATHGEVRLPPTATPADLKMEALALSTTQSKVIGFEYEHVGFGGRSYTHYSDNDCNDGYDIYFNDLGNVLLNDTISSARTYYASGCNHSYHYEHAGFMGSSRDCGTECFYIGDALNDRTSSIKWTR
jgi:hypothetical protein